MGGLALVGCGATVDTVDDGETGGASTSGEPLGGEPNAGGGGGGDGGGGGGGAGLGPFACAATAGAIVAASSQGSTRAAVMSAGSWTEPTLTLPAAYRITSYVDVYQHLGVFWIGTDPDAPSAHFATTFDGTDTTMFDATSWSPLSYGVLQPAGPFMVGSVEGGAQLAYMDADLFDWYPISGGSDLLASSAANPPGTGDVFTVGVENETLCDQQFISFETWGAKQCHGDRPVVEYWAGEVPVTPPQVIALPNGRVLAVHYTPQSSLALAVVERQDGGWAPRADTTSVSVAFAAAATPDSELLVFTALSDGLHALRYSPSEQRWTADLVIDTGADFSQLVAATGVCGDDALVAYATGLDAEVRVVRVRGDQAETRSLFSFVESQPYQLSVATRP